MSSSRISRCPSADGLDVIKRCKMLNEGTVVLMMTAYGTVESAVDAMKAGAHDYVLKPFDLEELELKVDRGMEHRRLRGARPGLRPGDHHPQVREHRRRKSADEGCLPDDREGGEVQRQRADPGRDGRVGKELVAEALHRNSGRQEQAFVKMNCAALHENLLESELFGHERGAFTGADRQRIGRFELANGGTLFLDEIGNMSLATQVEGAAGAARARVRAPRRGARRSRSTCVSSPRPT